MILTALYNYYNRLASATNPETGLRIVPDYGYSMERISYILVINKEGELLDIQNNFVDGKEFIGKYLVVPWSFKRSGKFTEKTFNEGKKQNAFFLWDKSAYCLGVESKDNKTLKISQIKFEAYKKFHIDLLSESKDEGLQAVYSFIKQWSPDKFNSPPFKIEMANANFVYKLDGRNEYIHEHEDAKRIWLNSIKPGEDVPKGNCLITGKFQPIKMIHPSIKGGYLTKYGGLTPGCSLVTFDKPSFRSYGKEKGENAPISEHAAFAYWTALGYLLRRDNNQCVSIGDTSTVFWAVSDDNKASLLAESLFGYLMNMQPDDSQLLEQLKPFMKKISNGQPLDTMNPDIPEETKFFVLGIAPNKARLSIRYWLDTNFGDLTNNFVKHYQDLSIVPSAWTKPPTVWHLLSQIVPLKQKSNSGKGKNTIYQPRNKEDTPDQLAGELVRAILTGQRYPNSLLARLILRIRSDGCITPLRIAMIKSVLNRNFRFDHSKEAIPMSLNKEEINIGYRLGRLFAVLELAQNASLGDLNASIKDRFFAGASSSPRSTFPILVRNYQHHISGLRKDKKAKWVKNPKNMAVWLENETGQIMSGFSSLNPFPVTLSLSDQGKFLVGYYHQKFTKQSDTPDECILDQDKLNTENQLIGE